MTTSRYRYLDSPVRLSDGTTLRYPFIAVIERRGLAITARLFKRRRRCSACGHRHGPTRNLPAKKCCVLPTPLQCMGGRRERCGCTHMTDWLHPAKTP